MIISSSFVPSSYGSTSFSQTISLTDGAKQPDSFEITWLYRLHAPWSVGLGVSEADAKAFGAQIDEAWLAAVLDVETVVPSVTHDYEVSYKYVPIDVVSQSLGRFRAA